MKNLFPHLLMVGLAGSFMLSSPHTIHAASLFGSSDFDPDVEYETRSKYRRTAWYNNQGQLIGLSITSSGRRKKLNAEDFLTALLSFNGLAQIRYLKIKDSGMQQEHWERFVQILGACYNLERLYISNRIRPESLQNANSIYLSINGAEKGIVLPDERHINLDLRTLGVTRQTEILKTPDTTRIRRHGILSCFS